VNHAARRHPVRLPAAGHLSGVTTLAASVTLPERLDPASATVAFCFPGGGMTRRYYELGEPFGPYDMAAALARAGLIVIAIDHPGIGQSDTPDDPWALVPEAVATIDATAAAAALGLLHSGGLLPALSPIMRTVAVGLGHSMGGLLVTYQQAQHRLYDGLVVLGHSGAGLPSALGPAEHAVAGDPAACRTHIVELAKSRFGEPLPPSHTATSEFLVGPSLPPEAVAAAETAADRLLACCGLTSMIPGSHDAELAAIDVPVFVGLAEHDIGGPTHRAPQWYTACRDLTLHVLPAAHHNANLAPTRNELWTRIARWCAAVPGASAPTKGLR
jgi:alpha-beta hydrolase superfamily lysophospholipase